MNSYMVFLCAISNFLPVSWCFYWQIFRPTDGNSRLPKVQKVDTQIALTLADDGWLWCDFLFCWYVVFVAKTNSHAREGVRPFKWLLSWIEKYSTEYLLYSGIALFFMKKREQTQKMCLLYFTVTLNHRIWQILLLFSRSKWNMGEILAFLA